jgi:hypothetical protein
MSGARAARAQLAKRASPPDDEATPSAAAKGDNPWISQIERAQRAGGMTKWDTSCEAIRKQYRYEESANSARRKFAMLWSNIAILKGATYAKPPHANVARRYRDKDDTARVSTLMLERAINFTFDLNNYDERFRQVRDDFLMYARGVARVIYEPVTEAVALPDDGLDGTDAQGPQAELEHEVEEAQDDDLPGEGDGADEHGEQPEILTFEHVKIKFVQRKDFVHSPARTWDEVKWLAFRSYLARDGLVKRFGQDIGSRIGLDAKSALENSDRDAQADEDPQATIWEVWDKENNRVLWVAQEFPDVLEEGEPYLKFSEFFPCPRPAYGTLTNDSLVPRPDYVFYQDQAEEVNALTARIAALQDSLKVVGFYPAGPAGEGYPEIERAANPGVENKMIAVKNFGSFAEKGGAPIVWWPIEQVVKVLEGCVKLRAQLIEDIYQITGLSDIIRGATDPNETKGAQVLKAQHGGMRISERQGELARFCRDVTRLVGEVIANHFQPETLMAMANMPLPTDQDVLQQLQAQLAAQQQAQAQQAHIQALNAQVGGAAGTAGQPSPQGAPGVPSPLGAPANPAPPSIEEMQRAEIQQRMNHAQQQHEMAMRRGNSVRTVIRDEHGRVAGIA